MNKYLFILGFAGMALFSACSTSDELAADIPIPSPGLTEEEKALIVEAGKDSDVPITLGTVANSRATTRLPIDSDDGTNLFETPDGQYLGVFCLARGKQEGAPDFIGDDVKWSTAYASSFPYANWKDNVPAKVVKYDNDPSSPIKGGEDKKYSYVQFMKDDLSDTKVYYYPFGNWYYYDFYAYYPRQASVTTNAESCSVRYEIDGSQDIIWGQALGGNQSVVDMATSTTVKAYSSKYLRLRKENISGTDYDVVPGLTFNHKLTQFTFSVKAHDATHAAQLYTKEFKLKSLKLLNVYKKLQLIIASKDDNLTAGELSIYDTSSTSYGDISVKNATDDSDPLSTSISVATAADDVDPKGVGYVIVPSSEMIAGKTHDKYLVSIELEQRSGEEVPNTIIQLTPPAGGFLAGSKYQITIDIYNPMEIQATATLLDWENEAETVIGVD